MGNRLVCSASVFAVIAVLAVAVSPAQADGPGATLLLSRPTGFGALSVGGDDLSVNNPNAVSADGRYTVFESEADDLGVADTTEHVWLRDSTTNTTSLIDRAPGGAVGNGETGGASMSGDGSKICFTSEATNLVPGVTDGHLHIFLASVTSGTVTAMTVVDRSSSPSLVLSNAAFGSGPCALDQTGHHVVFTSSATNLASTPGANNGETHVYMRDVSAGTTALVDESGGTATADGAGDPAITTDSSSKTWVAFDTEDSLVAADTQTDSDVYVRDMSGLTQTLVSRADGAAGVVGNADSEEPSISDDGNVIEFESGASNLGDGDADTTFDIHVRNVSGGTTTLASRADGVAGAKGNAESFSPSISGDGTIVAFASVATNLGATGPAGSTDEIFVRNLSSHNTSLASRATGSGGAPDTGDPSTPVLDVDGEIIVWTSAASNLDPAGTGDFFEVYRRVRSGAFTTALVSRPTGVGARSSAVNLSSSGFDARTISADGRIAAFSSQADAIDPLAAGPFSDVFARDTLTGATTLVSRAAGPDGAPGNGFSSGATVSADGTKVAFYSNASTLIAGVSGMQVYERDLATGALTLVSRANGAAGAAAAHVDPSGSIALSADGSRVEFTADDNNLVAGDTNNQADVFVRDLNAGTTTIASTTASGGPGNGFSIGGSLSSDGTLVAFYSTSSNLGDGVPNNNTHVHVRDLLTGTLTLVDRADGATGTPAVNTSIYPQLSADGTRVVFTSTDPLTADAGTTKFQIYVRNLLTATTTLASRADGAGGGPIGTTVGEGFPAGQISYDGNTVSFQTGTVNQQAQTRNLVTNTTSLVGAVDGSLTTPGDASSTNGSLDVDGSCVVFTSKADNLTSPNYATEDFNQVYAHVVSRECPLVAPDTIIDRSPTGTIHVPTATFSYHSTEPGTFACQVDGNAFATCGASFTTPPLTDGVHRFAVAATDAAGNTDPTPALAMVTVEVPPTLSAVSMTNTTFKDSSKTTKASARAVAAKVKAKAKPKTRTGTTFRYTLSETASLKIEIDKQSTGRRKTSKSTSSCVKSTHAVRKHKSCTRLTEVVTLKRAKVTAGKHTLAFTGRWSKTRKLADGSYEAKVSATDPSGNRSSTKTLHFKVVKK